MNRAQLIAAIERASRTEVWSAAISLWVAVDEAALVAKLVNGDGREKRYPARFTGTVLRIG